MRAALRSMLHPFLMPGGLVLIGVLLAARNLPEAPTLKAHLAYAPPVILSLGIFLGWRFRRTGLIVALLTLAVADRLLLSFPGGDSGRYAANAISVSLPLVFALLARTSGTSPSNLRRLAQFGFLLAPLVLFLWLYHYHGLATAAWLERSFVPWHWLGALPHHQAAFATHVTAAVVLLCPFGRRLTPLDAGFFWALAAASIATAHHGREGTPTLYFTAAALVLVLAAIESSYAMAFRDDLTGLPGRRALNERLPQLGRHYTVAMVDIDHFKKVNDRHGHDAGDEVLRRVAAQLARVTGGGTAYRYGGEEFSVLFPGKGLPETLPHLERLREAVAASRFVVRGASRTKRKPRKATSTPGRRRQIPVTVSIGAAERAPRSASAEQVVKAADRALYRAKKGGRNQVRR
ncbi:MAG: GGDEF domain-containing protein [Deferrisomatales bacterium]|nr:GGDEF domain-containing protein [Deferrisomatales bacterium]